MHWTVGKVKITKIVELATTAGADSSRRKRGLRISRNCPGSPTVCDGPLRTVSG
jgi:hypothetical protein